MSFSSPNQPIGKGKKQWLELDDFDRDLVDSSDENSDDQFKWYSARVYLSNENKVIESLWDKIRQSKLTDVVKEIISIKETVIQESDELNSESPELPKTEFKSSKSSAWIQLKNGNFKKISLKVKKPFQCFIFLKMIGDYDLFALIQSWGLGIGFLGFPKPNFITESEMNSMRQLANPAIPSLEEYIKEKGYTLVAGKVSEFTSSNSLETLIEDELYIEESGYSEPLEKDIFSREFSVDTIPSEEVIRKEVSLTKLKVNDFVYLIDMGAKGVVREIDLKNKKVTVNINLFGRNQTIKCDLQQLREF